MADEHDVLDAFEVCRPAMLGVATRIVGSREDAEDVVQEAWLRWARTDHATVNDPRTFLVRVVSRLALDRLRRIAARREVMHGDQEDSDTEVAPPPVAAVEQDDAITRAMELVLATLSPLERSVFVLHEAFSYSYGEISEMLAKSPEAVRQVAHRARAHVRARRPRYGSDLVLSRTVADQFVAATNDGDIPGVVELLAPRAIRWTSRPEDVATRTGSAFFSDADNVHRLLDVGDQIVTEVTASIGQKPTPAAGKRAAMAVANWVYAHPRGAQTLHLLNRSNPVTEGAGASRNVPDLPWPDDRTIDRAKGIRYRLNDSLTRFAEGPLGGADVVRVKTVLIDVPYAFARRALATGRSFDPRAAIEFAFDGVLGTHG